MHGGGGEHRTDDNDPNQLYFDFFIFSPVVTNVIFIHKSDQFGF